MRVRHAIIFILVLVATWSPSVAVEPDEVLKDPALEQRARKLSLGLRCLVCQNQSIDDSNAPLARDLRILVRERLTKGDTDEQIIDYVVARYGEYVLLSPRLSTSTLLLWFATPLALLLAAAFLYVNRRRQTATTANPPLSDEEKRRLDKLLSNDD